MASSNSTREGDDKLANDDAEGSASSQAQHIDQQKSEPVYQTHPTSPAAAVESAVSDGGDVTNSGSPAAAPEEALLTNVTTSPPVSDESVSERPASGGPVPSPAAAERDAQLPESACHIESPPHELDTEPARVELPEPAPAPAPAERHVSDTAHHIKWVQLHGARSPVITQNVNGPCPLLALINVMLLKGKVQLPSALEVITIGQLMDYIGDTMLDSAPAQSQQPDFQQNMQDAVSILPKLQTGLDVNVKFCG